LNPGIAWGFSGLATCYSRVGNLPQAIAAAQSAVEIDPQTPYFHVLLGQIYSKQGLIPQARIEIQKALELDPSYEFARQEINKLDRSNP